jgi:hypothetical protein
LSVTSGKPQAVQVAGKCPRWIAELRVCFAVPHFRAAAEMRQSLVVSIIGHSSISNIRTLSAKAIEISDKVRKLFRQRIRSHRGRFLGAAVVAFEGPSLVTCQQVALTWVAFLS